MSFKYLKKIPTVEELTSELPVPETCVAVKKKRDHEIAEVITGASDRFLVIIGPCSAHDEVAVLKYVSKLAGVNERVQEKLIIIPRMYTNKPRTTGEGYKGMAHQPDPMKEPDITEGIRAIRQMHIKSLCENGLSAADEMLYPENYPYLEDLLSYVTVGARSVENQHHRLTISGLEVAAGMKNPTSGDLSVMFNAVYAAQLPHVFVYRHFETQTTGNPLAHCILRGAVNHFGHSIPNYHFEDLQNCAKQYGGRGLTNPSIIVDTNHSNSNKQYMEQPRIAFEIMESRKKSPLIRSVVKGLMVESFLLNGNQKPGGTEFGKSITDPCIGWEETEDLILRLADLV